MKLLTAAILKKLPKLYATEDVAGTDKMLQVKFFTGGRGTWYGVEFDGVDTFFGYCVSPLGDDCDEWGYFSLAELEANHIERDLYWQAKKFSEEIR